MKLFWKKDSPERQAAKEWWRKSRNSEAICDSCNKSIRCGDGYLLDGRLMALGDTKINLGKELLCKACFEQLRNEPRDPGARGDDYVRIG